MKYISGDTLGIYPQNKPSEVEAVISSLHCYGDEEVMIPLTCYLPRPEWNTMCLKNVLQKYYDLKNVKPDLIKVLIESTANTLEKERGETLLSNGVSII